MNVRYYESHVTVEPVFGEQLEIFRVICMRHQFRVADLLMQKRKEDLPERSAKDTFCTGRGTSYDELMSRMNSVAEEAVAVGIRVWRKKIEAVVYDERLK